MRAYLNADWWLNRYQMYRDTSPTREISGDSLLSKSEKLLYLALNLTRGVLGYNFPIRCQPWHPPYVEPGRSHPARKHINQFLMRELSKIIPIGDIDILDIGCGPGVVQRILSESGYTGSYTGLDIDTHVDFEKNATGNFQSSLVQCAIEQFDTTKRFDLVMSIAALEHIKDDRLAVLKCDRFLKPGGVQVHFIPSFWSLFLYVWHGYRQYTPRRIGTLFGEKEYALYKLGGLFSFLLHFLFGTIPVFVFGTDKMRSLSLYSKLTQVCNRLDITLPVCPAFYVVAAKKNIDV